MRKAPESLRVNTIDQQVGREGNCERIENLTIAVVLLWIGSELESKECEERGRELCRGLTFRAAGMENEVALKRVVFAISRLVKENVWLVNFGRWLEFSRLPRFPRPRLDNPSDPARSVLLKPPKSPAIPNSFPFYSCIILE